MQIKLHQLRAFNAVAEQGSIRSASRLLSLSQPAVTKAVKELEESLGTSLVLRGAKGAVLTHCGEAFYQRSRLILRELHLAQEDVRQHLDSTGGSVYIGVAASIAVSLMPEVVARFMQEFPKARIQVSDGQIQRHIQRLRQGEIDFCINTAPPNTQDGDLAFEKLVNMEFALVVRRDHPLAQATKLEEFAHCDWLMPPSRPGIHSQLSKLIESHGLQPRQRVTCDSFIAAISIAAHTDCIAPVSEASLLPFLAEGKVVRIPLETRLPLATFFLIQRADSPLTPLAARLAQLFRMHVRPKYKTAS